MVPGFDGEGDGEREGQGIGILLTVVAAANSEVVLVIGEALEVVGRGRPITGMFKVEFGAAMTPKSYVTTMAKISYVNGNVSTKVYSKGDTFVDRHTERYKN